MVDCSCLQNIPYFNVKLHYFIFNAALACIIPYLPIHAKDIGISAAAVGLIYSFMPLVTMVLKPLFGGIADHYDNLRTILYIFTGGLMMTSTLTVSIPGKVKMIESEIRCTETGTTFNIESEPIPNCTPEIFITKTLTCYMFCSECRSFKYVPSHVSSNPVKVCAEKIMHTAEATLTLEQQNSSVKVFDVQSITLSDMDLNTLCFVNLTLSCSSHCDPLIETCYREKDDPEYSSDQFWLFLLFATAAVSASGAATSFSDAICFNELGENGHLYGRQRLWGTIGWGLLSPVAGYLNELVYGNSFLRTYQPGAFLQMALLLYDLLVIKRLKTHNLKCSQNIFKDVGALLKQFKIIAFLMSVLVIGSFTALMWSYLFWHLINLGANRIVLGVVPAVQCFLGELVFFFFSGKLIAKLGAFNILTINFVCFGLRFIAYSYIVDPWMVLPIELLQGPTYGLFYATMASFAHDAALPGTEVTVQGLVGSAFELGMVFGNLLGGFSMQSQSGALTFFHAGLISLAYCVIHVVFSIIARIIDQNAKQRALAAAPPATEEAVSFM